MSKVLIVYDSKTGNTEKMAKAIAEGASTVSGVDVELKKLGEPFAVTLLDEADAIIMGSPAHYADASREMRDFIESVAEQKKAGTVKLQGKVGVAFGSYGWDAGVSLEKLGTAMKQLGIILISGVLTAVDTSLQFDALSQSSSLQKCHELGKTVANYVDRH
jgi:NAD(P)H dehydrogenase (quinone)